MNELHIKDLAKRERDLWRRYGIRLNVDKVTSDGSKLLCTASRTRKSIFHAYMPIHEVMEHSYIALSGLSNIGGSAFISAVPRKRVPEFKEMDVRDPFGIITAISSQEHRSHPHINTRGPN